MADRDVKSLLLEVDASVELLRTNLQRGDKLTERFTTDTKRRLDDMDRRFAQFGKPLVGIGSTVTKVNAQIATIGNSVDAVERRMRASSQSIRASLLATASGIAAAFTADRIKGYADGYTRFTNQLKVAGLEGNQLAQTQENLYGIAQKYGVQLESVGALYGRASQAAKALGASQSDLLRFTNGVGAALKVQGGSAEAAQGALLQLSQLLGTGTVRAEEFNSVNEGARPILQAVANGIDKYKGSVAALRSGVIAGELSSQDFFNGFLRGSAQLETQATKANLTIAASFTVLDNALGRYIGQTDEAYSLTARGSAAVVALANNLDTVIPALAGIAAGFAVMKGGQAAFAGLSTAIASVAQADAEVARQVLLGNASFVDRAGLQAKIAIAAQQAAASEVAAIEEVIAARRAEAVQLEANLALIAEQRAAALASVASAAGLATANPLGNSAEFGKIAQREANDALKAQLVTKRALTAVNAEVAVSETALATAQVRSAAATEASAAATRAATLGAKASAAATAVLTGAMNLLAGALPVLAIGALVAGIIYYRQAARDAEAQVKAFTDRHEEAAQALRETATFGSAAASVVTQVGANAGAATGKVIAFAGAVGEAAEQLRQLAIQQRDTALGKLQIAGNSAQLTIDQASARINGRAQSGGSVARFGYLPQTTGDQAADDADRAAIARAQADLKALRGRYQAIAGRSLDQNLSESQKNGGRDITGELAAARRDLKVASAGTDKAEVNRLKAKVYELTQYQGYRKQGFSDESAKSQSSADAEKLRAAGQSKIDAASNRKAGSDAAAAKRKETAAVVDAANDTRAYKAAERQALDSIAASNADLTNSAEARAQIERDRIETDRASKNEEIAQQGLAGRYTKERVKHLQELNNDAAKAAAAVVDRREEQRVAQDALDVATRGLSAQQELLSSASQLATTAGERRVIELRLLELQRQEETLRLQHILAFNSGASEGERQQAVVDLNTQDARYGAKAGAVIAQTASPLEAYGRQLDSAVGSSERVKETLESIEVHAVEGLTDELSGAVAQALHLHGIFGQIAQEIAKIAIQKAVLSIGSKFFGLADGGPVLRRAGGGDVSGPGSSTSDSIPAMLSNGEYVINAAATRRFRPLIEAINAQRLPGFSDGGLVAPKTVARAPSLRRIGQGRMGTAQQEPQRVIVDVAPSPFFVTTTRVAAMSAGQEGARAAIAGAARPRLARSFGAS